MTMLRVFLRYAVEGIASSLEDSLLAMTGTRVTDLYMQLIFFRGCANMTWGFLEDWLDEELRLNRSPAHERREVKIVKTHVC